MEGELGAKGLVEWELAIDSPRNDVAYATMVLDCEVFHGKSLEKKKNTRISITRAIQGSVKIQFLFQFKTKS